MRVHRSIRWLAALTLASTVAVAEVPAALGQAGPPRDIGGFACPDGLPAHFSDTEGSVHERAIACVYAYGVANGTGDTEFSPLETVTRGQMASFIARALAFNGVAVEAPPSGFTDLEGSPHAPAVDLLFELGVTEGTSPTTYSPAAPVTRAQAATLLGRALELSTALPADPPDAFADDDGLVPHEAYIDALAELGIVSGVTPDRYAPRAPVTRAAMASLVARTLDFAIEAGFAQPLEHVARIGAAMTGSQEVPGPGDPAARVTVVLDRFTVAGMLCVTWDIDVPLDEAATAAHVHVGAAGVAGPILFPLPTPQIPPGERGVESRCVTGLDQAAVDAVFEDPAGHYVNIHTPEHPDGAVRGQLSPPAALLGTALEAGEQVPGPGEEGAGGDAFIDVLADGTTVCGFLLYTGAATPTAAHIHAGPPGAAGPVVVTLPPFDEGAPGADGCVGGLDAELVAEIAANPENHYVDVHTDEHPAGAVRGQLQESVQLESTLTGGAEAPGPGDPDGDGRVALDVLGDGRLCVQLEVRGIDMPVAAHIHEAPPGVAGPIVLPLPTPVFNTVRTCVDAPPDLLADLATNPGDYYVNVHTARFPDGALRGQLAVDPL